MKKGVQAWVIAGVVILLICGGVGLYLWKGMSDSHKPVSFTADHGYELAMEQKLMQTVNVPFEGADVSVHEAYYDGQRLYITVKADKISDYQSVQFEAEEMNRNAQVRDHFYKLSDTEGVIVWNNYTLDSESICICFTVNDITHKTEAFEIKKEICSNIEVQQNYEEILVKSLKISKTGTFIDMSIYAIADIKGFQIEIDKEVYSCVSLEKEDNGFRVLFPAPVDMEKVFYIYALDENGMVLMTVPIDLKR